MASKSSPTVYDEQGEPSSTTPASIEMQINADVVNQTTAISLRKYALQGDLVGARSILERFPNMVRTPLTLSSGDTALHLAVIAKQTGFVLELVNSNLFTEQNDYLETRNADGVTAFCMAAILGEGNDKFFETMIQKSGKLPLIGDIDGMLPVHLAAFNGHYDIVRILISDEVMKLQTPEQHNTYAVDDIKRLFLMTIRSNMYAVATELLGKYPNMNLATAREGPGDQQLTALHMLARKPSSQEYYKQMASKRSLLEKLWSQVILLERKVILELINEPSIVLFDAVKSGNSYIVESILYMNPEFLRIKDPNGRNILHLAALHRRKDAFRFILSEPTLEPLKFVVDKNHNNVLHFAALYPDETSSSVKPIIHQMQEHLEWFEEVEKNVPPVLSTTTNRENKTPKDVLHTNQEKLSKQLKYSAKRTADFSMLVATLIATISFAAILTVPGDKSNACAILTVPVDKSNGTLIKAPSDDGKSNGWYIVFILANALAVLISSTCIVSFLSVLNSRRFTDSEIDILLHPRLILGLVLLFISITAMVIALVAALFLIFAHNSKWAAYSVALLAPLPIVLFPQFHTRILNDHGYSFVDVNRIWLEIKVR